jgi:hypothetical protein
MRTVTGEATVAGSARQMRLGPLPRRCAATSYEITFRGVLPGVDRVVAAMLRRTVPRGLSKLDGAA